MIVHLYAAPLQSGRVVGSGRVGCGIGSAFVHTLLCMGMFPLYTAYVFAMRLQ